MIYLAILASNILFIYFVKSDHKYWLLSIPLWILMFTSFILWRTNSDRNILKLETAYRAEKTANFHQWDYIKEVERSAYALNMKFIYCIGLQILIMQEERLKLLFICTVNRMRSATAHKIFESDQRFYVDSAGTDKSADTILETEHLEWADTIIVMEKHHRNFIREKYPAFYKKKKIVCLYIPDDFNFMQPELISILKDKVEDVYRRGLLGH